MKTYLSALVVAALLSGCAMYTPAGTVVVDPARAANYPKGKSFCPPGQAKKGNC